MKKFPRMRYLRKNEEKQFKQALDGFWSQAFRDLRKSLREPKPKRASA